MDLPGVHLALGLSAPCKGGFWWALAGLQGGTGGSQACGEVTCGCRRAEMQIRGLQNSSWRPVGSISLGRRCLEATRCTPPCIGTVGSRQPPRGPRSKNPTSSSWVVTGRVHGAEAGLKPAHGAGPTATMGPGHHNTAQGAGGGPRPNVDGFLGPQGCVWRPHVRLLSAIKAN